MKRFSKCAVLAILLLAVVFGCSKDDPVAPKLASGWIMIAAEPQDLDAPWELTGPGNVSRTASGDTLLATLPIGDYSLTWMSVPGWSTPTPATLDGRLATGDTLYFEGTYVFQTGTITITTSPENAPWSLVGPGLNESGAGGVVFLDQAPGLYTITWGALEGYDTPDPAEIEQELVPGGSLAFSGVYGAQAGTITITTTSDDAPWTIVGPDLDESGSGSMLFEDQEPGLYILTWHALDDHDLPDPSIVEQELAPGGSLEFFGTYTPYTGTITITTTPGNAPWTIEGPEGFDETGAGGTVFENLVPGLYTVTWRALDGHDTPDPSVVQQTLEPAGALTFTGVYGALAGTITISTIPDNAPWTIEGPGLQDSGAGGMVFADQEPGLYTVTWLDVDGWNTPDPAQIEQELVAGGSLEFAGVYGARPGKITIVTTPGNAPWTIAGPDLDESGVGGTVFEDQQPGFYTITWMPLDGHDTPVPAQLQLELLSGGDLLFAGIYLQHGTVTITTTPDDAPWSITGPGLDESGLGNRVFEGCSPGIYTVTWLDLDGWNIPDPAEAQQELVPGGSLTFAGVYEIHTGTVAIELQPVNLSAPWQLAGPDGFIHEDSGSKVLTDLAVGSYTVTWGEMSGWNQPDPVGETLILLVDEVLAFTGAYTAQPGTITISPTPSDLSAPWLLEGPGGFSESGYGSHVLQGMAAGEYRITWDHVEGWRRPNPHTYVRMLAPGGTRTFTGTYLPPTGTITINTHPADIGAPWSIVGPDDFVESGNGAAVMDDLPIGFYTLTWGSLIGHTLEGPDTVVEELRHGGEVTFTGVYNSDMIHIESGSFWMGSPHDEPGRHTDEERHQVTLTREFYLSQFLVTESLWDEVMGERATASQIPKSHVSWLDAVVFCNALSELVGLTPAYTIRQEGIVVWNQDANGYRLPTEAEWEYACRAGTTMAYSNDTNCLSSDWEANFLGNRHQMPDCPTGIYRGSRTEVGSFPSNPWGLYDMHGNMWEWVWDAYRADYENLGAVDPVFNAPPSAERVVRGGAWDSTGPSCRSARRMIGAPSAGYATSGFRLARTIVID